MSLEWLDLDEPADFDLCCARLRSENTRRFAARFNATRAQCLPDIDETGLQLLLEVDPSDKHEPMTRWINIWANEDDRNIIRAIGKRYGLPARLTALLCASGSSSTRTQALPPHGQYPPVQEGKGPHMVSDPKTRNPKRVLPGFGDVVSNLWHWCSIDSGSHYLYMGFNAIYTIPGVPLPGQSTSSKPYGLRIWTSLLLCSDGTMVSIFEQPPPGTPREYIAVARSNVMNIMRHLSATQSPAPTDLMNISIRTPDTASSPTFSSTDTASLLLFYLFDDWMATYNLINGRNHLYRGALDKCRQEMFATADVGLIKSLDLVGRRLTALSLVYKSYELIIRRILNRQAQLQKAGGATADSDWTYDGPPLHGAHAASPRLSPSAVLRFERALDRIQLFVLTEIEDCLREKDSLAFMNFNLVNLKESQTIEKLTRNTVLLAKATILFLPVSLMTGYFSIQLPAIADKYDLTTYWVAFLVVVMISIVGLAAFEARTERVAGCRSWTRKVWLERWKRKGEGKGLEGQWD